VKTLIVSLIIWTFILPSMLSIYLLLAFLGASMPSFCFALIGLVVALVNLVVMRGLFWIPQSTVS
jgi:hypothetical protein